MKETENLELCFEKMMVENIGTKSGGETSRGVIKSEWKDIPVELLLRILSLVDDQTVIVAAGVCHGWRDAISWGLTHLSLSWYIHIFQPLFSSVNIFLNVLMIACLCLNGDGVSV